MAAFNWRPEYALDISETDRQHEEIFCRLAGLEAALEAGEEGASIQALLESARQHTTFHFGAEEKLLGEEERLTGDAAPPRPAVRFPE